jgi:hypothetical protein
MGEQLELEFGDFLEVLRGKISAKGWTVAGNLDGSVTSTVGLTERGWPELVISNFPVVQAGEMLSHLVDFFLARGRRPEPGEQIPLVDEDHARAVGIVLQPFPDVNTLTVVASLYADCDFYALEVQHDPRVPLTGRRRR